MNDEVKYPVIKPEDLPEEEWQGTRRYMETNGS